MRHKPMTVGWRLVGQGSPSSGLPNNQFLPATLYLLQNVAGGGGPDDRFRVGVVGGKASPDRCDPLGHILENATPQSPLRQIVEKPLHHVEPGGTGWGPDRRETASRRLPEGRRAATAKMELEVEMPFCPCYHGRVLVGRIPDARRYLTPLGKMH